MGIPVMVLGEDPGIYTIEVLFPSGTRYFQNIVEPSGKICLNDMPEKMARDMWNEHMMFYYKSARYNSFVANIYKWDMPLPELPASDPFKCLP